MVNLELAKLHALHGPVRGASVGKDLAPAFTIWHTGAPSMSTYTPTTVTTATIEYDTSDDFTFTINGAADTRLGASGKIDTTAAATDTILELYNKINAIPGWCFRPEAALMADAIYATSDRRIVTKAETSCFQEGVTFYWDTEITTHATNRMNAVISNRRIITMNGEERGQNKIALMEDEGGATNTLNYLSVNCNVAGTTPVLTLKIYSCNGVTRTDTLLAHQVLPDNSAETYNFEPCGGLSALPGEHLVLEILNTAGATDATVTITSLIVNGKSIGGRWCQ